jgi:ribose-phosphate pyrophosphokinase
MITVQDKIIDAKRFPDGTQMLLDFKVDFEVDALYRPTPIKIVWCYESEDEALTLLYIKKHLENNYKGNVELHMPYVPNARMDRVKSDKEVFTLKHFCWFINSLGFDKVYIMDPHSIVSEALIDNVCVLRPSNIISDVINKMHCLNDSEREIMIYFPDDGAYKRYKDLPCFKDLNCVYGKKERDWNTGQILGIEIYDKNGCKLTNELENCDVLMVDDIISYGGTLAYSADKLKAMGAAHISAYATHVEDSAINTEKGTLLKRINSGIVDFVYTTNSLFHEEHPNFVIVHKF